MTKICFMASGPIQWASSRYRAWWVAPFLEDAVVVEMPPSGTVHVPEVDVYIWQKRVNLSFMRAQSNRRHWWDICDPLWWFSPSESREIIDVVEGVVCSNQGLADDFQKWSGKPAHVIPDRFELSHFDRQREHSDTKPVRFIWFGMSQNRVALAGAWSNLARLAANGYDISLTIMDDKPGVALGYGNEIPVYYTPWSLEREVEIIAAHDIALLPPFPGPWGKVKSENKKIMAQLCGIHAISGLHYDNLTTCLTHYLARKTTGITERARKEYDVRLSAADWGNLLNDDG